jgi:hypothetical protein
MLSIQKVTQSIQSTITKLTSHIFNGKIIPPILILCAATQRPGLSAVRSTTNILSKLNAMGIPTGKGPDGSDNLIVKFVEELCKENKRAITMDAVFEGACNIGDIVVQGIGECAAGPVSVTGTNTNIAQFPVINNR